MKATNLGTVAGMTGLIGVSPLLITFLIARSVDLPALSLTIIHVTLMVLGTMAFMEWFGNG